MQQSKNTSKENISASSLTPCPWQILAKAGKLLTQQELQFNQLTQRLFELILDFKKEENNCHNLLSYFYNSVIPVEDEYFNATKKYIQHLFSVYKTHNNQFTAQEKEAFESHYFEQLKVYFGDANMPNTQLTPSFEQALPLDLNELWDTTFLYRREYAFLLLISFGIYITPDESKKVVNDATLETLIKKLTNDYFMDTRSSKKQDWHNFSITANTLLKELHRQHIKSLRKIELWNETKKMNNFIFNYTQNPVINRNDKLWATAYENSRKINYDLINSKVDLIMEKHLGTIMELLNTDLVQSADLENLIAILGSHIRFVELIVPDYRLQHRLYLPLIEIGLTQNNIQTQHQTQDQEQDQDQIVDLPFLEEKIKFYNQKKVQKEISSQILSINNQASVQFLKDILKSEQHLADIYNVYYQRDIFIVPETVS